MADDSKKVSDCQTVDVVFSVYAIWCAPTNRYYVGVTGQDVYKRIRQHKKGKKQFVDKEIRRIGWENNFDYWVVEENVPSNLITEREQYWVAVFNSVYPNGYNKTKGGIKHFKHSKTTCDQISASHTGKKREPFSDEHKANLSKALKGKGAGKPAHNRGVPCSEETKDKIRKKLTGRKQTDETKAKIGKGNRGKRRSEETKAKLREKALARDMSGERNPHYGKKHTDETKAIISAKMSGTNSPSYGKPPANKGVPHTPEELAKMSAANKGEKNPFFGKHHSEETRAILREKALIREARKRVAKENLAAAQSFDAVIFQEGLRSQVALT